MCDTRLLAAQRAASTSSLQPQGQGKPQIHPRVQGCRGSAPAGSPVWREGLACQSDGSRSFACACANTAREHAHHVLQH
eukprot:1685843-Alexandrium_andersonii.AAC.1